MDLWTTAPRARARRSRRVRVFLRIGPGGRAASKGTGFCANLLGALPPIKGTPAPPRARQALRAGQIDPAHAAGPDRQGGGGT